MKKPTKKIASKAGRQSKKKRPVPTTRKSYIICKKCSKRSPKGAFCGNCGAPTSSPPPPEALSVKTAIGYFFFLTFFSALAIPLVPGDKPLKEFIVSSWVFTLLPILLVLRGRKIPFRKALFITKPRLSEFGVALLFTLGIVFVETLVSHLEFTLFPGLEKIVENLWRDIELAMKQNSFLLGFFAIAVTPAICEEVFTRGMLFSSLLKRVSPVAAMIISAVLFALLHLHFSVFVVGVMLAYLVYRTKSIFPAMAAHFLNNLLYLLILRSDLPVEEIDELIVKYWIFSLLIAACLVAAGLWVLNHGERQGAKKRSHLRRV